MKIRIETRKGERECYPEIPPRTEGMDGRPGSRDIHGFSGKIRSGTKPLHKQNCSDHSMKIRIETQKEMFDTRSDGCIAATTP